MRLGNGGVWSPRPTEATQVVSSEGPMWASAPTGRRASRINHPGQRRTAERLRRGWEGWEGIAAEIIPKVSSNLGQSLSQPAADSSLYTREPWGRGMRIAVTSAPNFGTKFGWRWLHPRRVGPAGLLAMTTVFCHSEASAHTGRGNPSFLRWTGVRAAEVVGPYGKPNQPPKPAGAQRSVCASGREGWAGIGAKTIPNGGPPRNLPGSALSAERAAGQIRSLPDDIRVQHGVQRLEVSAKPRPCSRRGCGN